LFVPKRDLDSEDSVQDLLAAVVDQILMTMRPKTVLGFLWQRLFARYDGLVPEVVPVYTHAQCVCETWFEISIWEAYFLDKAGLLSEERPGNVWSGVRCRYVKCYLWRDLDVLALKRYLRNNGD
jgi:hypothetical protein